MVAIKLSPRESDDLRCAFCHGPLEVEPRPCRSCFTQLHDECWDEAGVCPTLGCATWMRLAIRIAPRIALASWWLLGAWLVAFAVCDAIAVGIVPAFAQMFRDTGFCLPALTECVVATSNFACSPLGYVAAGAVVVGSIVVFRRHRCWPHMRATLSTLVFLCIAAAGLTAYSLFLPLVNCCGFQKL